MDSQSQYQPFGLNAPGRTPPSLLSKLLAFVLSAGLLILAFMFSLVALAVVAIGGAMLGGWLWWRTRKLRKEIRRQRAAQRSGTAGEAPFGRSTERFATVIDGEAIRISEDAPRPSAPPLQH